MVDPEGKASTTLWRVLAREAEAEREQEADPPGLLLLFGWELVRQDGDEHQVVDAEHDLEQDERDEGGPGGGVGEKREDIHDALCAECGAPRQDESAFAPNVKVFPSNFAENGGIRSRSTFL